MSVSRKEQAHGGDFHVTANGTGNVLSDRPVTLGAASVGAGVALTTVQDRTVLDTPARLRKASISCATKVAVASVDPTVDVYATLPRPANAPSLTLVSVAGNVDNGAHLWAVSYVTDAGETTPSPTASKTVANKTVAGKVSVELPIGPTGVTARKLYRTKAAGTALQYLATVADNTTETYLDNIADAAMGGNVPAAPVAALAGAGAGNIENGAHVYGVTFVTADGESALGTISNTLTVADKTTDGKGALTGIPLGPAGTTARKVYRSKAGVPASLFLLTTLSDNTTATYTDNTADASLSTAAPTAPTAWPAPIANTTAVSLLDGAVSLSEADYPIEGAILDPVEPLPKGTVLSLRAATGASTGAITVLEARLVIEACPEN